MCRRSTLSSSELGWPEESNPPQRRKAKTRWYTSGGDGWSTSGDHGWYRSGDHGWYTQADYAWSSIGRSVTYDSDPCRMVVGRDKPALPPQHTGTTYLARLTTQPEQSLLSPVLSPLLAEGGRGGAPRENLGMLRGQPAPTPPGRPPPLALRGCSAGTQWWTLQDVEPYTPYVQKSQSSGVARMKVAQNEQQACQGECVLRGRQVAQQGGEVPAGAQSHVPFVEWARRV